MSETMAGTEFQTVTPAAVQSSSQWAGSTALSRSGITSAAPAERAPKTSHTDRSKLKALMAKNRSAGLMPKRSRQSATTLATLRWVTMTPLGSPVVPEV
ncbi:hypothetical protein GCM10020000_38480 [Streptomyces olivoverticillatus]